MGRREWWTRDRPSGAEKPIERAPSSCSFVVRVDRRLARDRAGRGYTLLVSSERPETSRGGAKGGTNDEGAHLPSYLACARDQPREEAG